MNITKRHIYIALGTLALLTFALYSLFNDEEAKDTDMALSAEPEVHIETFHYGFLDDTISLFEGTIKNGEFLADILLHHGVNYGVIDKLAKQSKPIFDVRKIKSGRPYSIIKSRDSLEKSLFFVYENSPELFTVFGLTDSLTIYQDRKEVLTTVDTIHGVIESSLWNAMRTIDAPPILSIELSEIYQWTIDFFGIQKGDNFTIVYERKYIDGEYIGIGEVVASRFKHADHDNFAFIYTQDTLKGARYYDEEGESLQRAFLKAPLKYSRISSRFSNSRMHPVLKIRRAHHGVDYAAPKGTPVFSIGDGKVIKKGYQKKGGGNYIKIKHNSVYTTVYMHLNGYAKGIHVGQHLKQGELIGYVGSTGLATGPHLDFRVFKNGTAIDPLKMESPPVKPIKPELMEHYLGAIQPVFRALGV